MAKSCACLPNLVFDELNVELNLNDNLSFLEIKNKKVVIFSPIPCHLLLGRRRNLAPPTLPQMLNYVNIYGHATSTPV